MSSTYELYLGDGEQTDFSIPFSFLSEDYIVVSVDGDEVAFEFIQPNTARVSPAPDDGAQVRVFRRTERDTLIAEIPSAGAIRGSDINLQSRQALDVTSEAFDALDATLAEDTDGNLDATDRRIVNVADPIDDEDVVTRQWAETAMSSELAQAITARTGAEIAESEAEDTADLVNAYRSDVYGWREDTEEARATTLNYRNTTEGFRDDTLQARDDTYDARDEAQSARDTTNGYRLNAQNSMDTAAEHRDDAGDFRDEAEAFRNTTLTYRNQAEGFRDEAQTAAQALGAVEINGSGEVVFTVNGTAVAKIDASGNFLVAGDIGVQQNI